VPTIIQNQGECLTPQGQDESDTTLPYTNHYSTAQLHIPLSIQPFTCGAGRVPRGGSRLEIGGSRSQDGALRLKPLSVDPEGEARESLKCVLFA
jgi:hypothetical protein